MSFPTQPSRPVVAIACGGTGGHLFPGLAIAQALEDRGCDIILLISPKEVDQQAVKSAFGVEILTLPAQPFRWSKSLPFFLALAKSFQISQQLFHRRKPAGLLAMGGFISVAPVLCAKIYATPAFLHEANSIPGLANRTLAPLAAEIFIAFPSAAKRLLASRVRFTGMPVRPEFKPADPQLCRMALGFDPNRPVILVMGGSQGARGINELFIQTLPSLATKTPHWQFLHLTGPHDKDKVRTAYQQLKLKAVVLPFLTEMELALGAATVALNRAGASSLAEIAAMRLPSILIPFPYAADNHQYYNAKAFMESGAARQLDQASATPQNLARVLIDLAENGAPRQRTLDALAAWSLPNAPEIIAERMLELMRLQPQLTQLKSPSPQARSTLANAGWRNPLQKLAPQSNPHPPPHNRS